ncbi:HU family DNA-binding protein [candidate division KSB1 bacterium]|nr:HU family DNA-binding protein [candidate division KSB1 bacterium]
MKDPILRSNHPSPLSPKEAGPLAERLAHAGGARPVFMRKFIKEVIAVIEEGLLRDGEVRIHNFGTFRLSQPKAPAGMNAKLGKAITPAERTQVVFQPSKHLRGLVNLSLGSTVPPGSRISLQALLEKHLRFSAPLVAPNIEAPSPEFDIVKTFPKVYTTPAPAFTLVEGETDKKFTAEELKLGEGVPEPASDRPPAFTLAEIEKETAIAFLKIKGQPEPPRPAVPRRRSRRFAWYASAAAVFLLLLLFLLTGRISEQSESGSFFGADTASTPTEMAGLASPQNGVNGSSAERTKPDEGLIKPSYESAAFFAGGTHRVAGGDNLWEISGTYYRDHYLWPNIYRVNTATMPNPDILQIDQLLEVPALHGPPEKLTAADRRNLAEGYFLLYRYYKGNASSLAPYALWAAVQYDAAIKTEHATELSEDDLAFLHAHGVRRALAER